MNISLFPWLCFFSKKPRSKNHERLEFLKNIHKKYGYYINYVAVTACIITVSILIQTWWFNRDSNSNKLPQSAPLPPPKDPRDRFIRPDEDKDDS